MKVGELARDRRLSRIIHVLIHMDRHGKRATSDLIAAKLHTNPVVVRRAMAGLRDMGIVSSEKGHGGGWVMQRELSQISLWDIYRAVGTTTLVNVGPSADRTDCLVEKSIESRIGSAVAAAESVLIARLSEIMVADLADDFEQRFAEIGGEVAADDRAVS